jgi:hypothetical protein
MICNFTTLLFVINIKADDTSGDSQSLKSAVSQALCTFFYLFSFSFSFISSFIDADHASPLLFVSKLNKREQH